MQYGIKIGLLTAALLTQTSCGSIDGKSDNGGSGLKKIPAASSAPLPNVSDYPVKIGDPFTVAGKTYTPEDISNYDDVGYASWYGAEFEGKPTANGEIFKARASSAAHKTLPLPSYVEVTSLDTGKTILVRINDRGPFANDRLIDLSEAAARELGFTQQGVSGVRVRKVNPPEQERAMLRSGQLAPSRLDTPESLLRILREKIAKLPKPDGLSRLAANNVPTTPASPSAAPPATNSANGRFIREQVAGAPRTVAPQRDAQQEAAAPVASNRTGGRFVREQAAGRPAPQYDPAPQNNAPAAPQSRDGRFVREQAGKQNSAQQSAGSGILYSVQLGSFGNRASADALARQSGARTFASADGRLYRVRYGPYRSEAEAEQARYAFAQRGYPQAVVIKD